MKYFKGQNNLDDFNCQYFMNEWQWLIFIIIVNCKMKAETFDE
jgi:hypothetical protein